MYITKLTAINLDIIANDNVHAPEEATFYYGDTGSEKPLMADQPAC
jgi:hypothetical protein